MTSWNFSGAPTPRPPETTVSALVRSTPVDLGLLDLDELAAKSTEIHVERGDAALARSRIGVLRAWLHRGHTHVARAARHLRVELAVEYSSVELEAVPGIDVEAVADEGRIERCGDARCHVPARSACWR